MKIIKDKTLLLLSSLGTAAFVFMNIIEYKPNRISQGIKYSSFQFFGSLGMIILILWLALLGLSFFERKDKNRLVFILAVFLLLALIWILQLKSGSVSARESSARISFSAGFYTQVFCLYLLFSTYTQRIKDDSFIIGIGFLSVLSVLVYLFLTGAFEDFSLIKEYNIKKTQFSENLRIHALLTVSSVVTGALIAIPLGFLAYYKKSFEDKVMVPLSIIETIPSLSLFGILLVPLSGLGKLPFFDALGVSGIGWAPAYIALTLYTLLPIGRNTLTGFYSVDKNIKEAAKGMGMSKRQVLQKIELPLAFPVIFTGIRIAFIQTIGGAVLAGLVGGGGMGTFVFLGLGEASPDLILLGVLPIVFFTVLLDYLLRAFEKQVRSVLYD
ncbi:Glycine betaine uptake system permease protein YehY [Jeotgalibaca dankookensis]|uniref:Glycine betaine uptake system permease protein YehY n=1 Tax=Jeotgalibaca dankookensis TaxID=708126 RepID=A0A1S6INK0_9LACT|nr:ABC transporter permease [Jeotgalibaca dankookensis]AQS53112.1 Glycine betaine uptake system permease protein YehY [Jeotgalibaca dankookensis]